STLRRGLVAEAHGGLLVLRGAEHMDPDLLAALFAVHESRVNRLEREAWSLREAADFRLLAVVDVPFEAELPTASPPLPSPEGFQGGSADPGSVIPTKEGLRSLASGFALSVLFHPLRSASLRAEAALRVLAFRSEPAEFVRRFAAREDSLRARLGEARARLSSVEVPPGAVRAAAELVRRAEVAGNRAEVELVFAAQALAAWEGRSRVEPEDVRRAAPWVLAHRSRRVEVLEEVAGTSSGAAPPRAPQTEEAADEAGEQGPPPENSDVRPPSASEGFPPAEGDLSEAYAPPHGSDDVAHEAEGGPSARESPGSAGPSAVPSETSDAERPAHLGELPREDPAVRRNLPRTPLGSGGGRGVSGEVGVGTGKALRPGTWKPETRIHWEGTVRRAAVRAAREGHPGLLLPLRHEDLVGRFVRGRRGTLLVFAVDLSGSMGGRRLALARRAALAFLAEAYVRRDRVAVVGFRGRTAEVLLPPTHSPERAHRLLQGVRTGGRTPLAQGIWVAAELLRRELRKRPDVRGWFVLLTDGRANVPLPPEADPVLGALRVAEWFGEFAHAAGIARAVVDLEEERWTRFGVAGEIAGAMGAVLLTPEEFAAGEIFLRRTAAR
ncbi:MAG TPA: VWA domain-containing protein, partial [Bacillaceae bacterium]|nr:VWA domain-containing protein [Bacillaceae bacterium]